MPTTVVFIIIFGVFAHSVDLVNIPMRLGVSKSGSVLNFGSVVYGVATG